MNCVHFHTCVCANATFFCRFEYLNVNLTFDDSFIKNLAGGLPRFEEAEDILFVGVRAMMKKPKYSTNRKTLPA